MRRILVLLIATVIGSAAEPLTASAQDWPTRPIRALTGTSPGGISDV